MSQRSRVRYPVRPHTFASPSADSRRAVVSYWRKYVHEILVNRLRGQSLPRKSVFRLTDRPDMDIDVYRGRKTTTQQQQQQRISLESERSVIALIQLLFLYASRLLQLSFANLALITIYQSNAAGRWRPNDCDGTP